jgi:hypothetical protein
VNGQRLPGDPVADQRTNFAALLHAQQRAGNLQWTTFQSEGLHHDARFVVAIGKPLAGARFETNREHTVGQNSTRQPIVVERNSLERPRRGALSHRRVVQRPARPRLRR